MDHTSRFSVFEQQILAIQELPPWAVVTLGVLAMIAFCVVVIVADRFDVERRPDGGMSFRYRRRR